MTTKKNSWFNLVIVKVEPNMFTTLVSKSGLWRFISIEPLFNYSIWKFILRIFIFTILDQKHKWRESKCFCIFEENYVNIFIYICIHISGQACFAVSRLISRASEGVEPGTLRFRVYVITHYTSLQQSINYMSPYIYIYFLFLFRDLPKITKKLSVAVFAKLWYFITNVSFF